MKRLFITGGCGFVGANFVQYVFDNYPNYHITVLDALTYASGLDNIPDKIKNDSRFIFHYGNIQNSNLVNKLLLDIDIVIHFAAETHISRSIFDNVIFYEVDVLGTQSIANAVLNNLKNIERFIHISTSEVYGTALEVPMTENHPLMPLTPYASAKVGADRLVYSYYKTYDIPAIILRPYNQYGSFQHLEKVIPRFITSALTDTPLTIHGSGNSTRDWTYVEDTCKAIDMAMNTKLDLIKGQVINIGTGKDFSIQTIAEMILSKLKKTSSLITYMSERLGQVDKHVSSTEKALKLLRWKAETEFENGLDKTILWYTNNRNWWEKRIWMSKVHFTGKDDKIEAF